MSSHSRKLAETLRMIESLKKSLKSTASENEYQRGLYNGFEMMRSMLSCQNAEILEKKFNLHEIIWKECFNGNTPTQEESQMNST